MEQFWFYFANLHRPSSLTELFLAELTSYRLTCDVINASLLLAKSFMGR